MAVPSFQDEYDIIIVGAGVAGSATAVAFARQGRRVLLLERNLREPDRIVGELLQPGGVDALSELGLAGCLEGIEATPIEGYHLYWKDQEASFWFCETNGKKPEGRSFHHGKFVTKLREAASICSNVDVLETTVTEIIREDETGRVKGVLCSMSDGQQKVGDSRCLTRMILILYLNLCTAVLCALDDTSRWTEFQFSVPIFTTSPQITVKILGP